MQKKTWDVIQAFVEVVCKTGGRRMGAGSLQSSPIVNRGKRFMCSSEAHNNSGIENRPMNGIKGPLAYDRPRKSYLWSGVRKADIISPMRMRKEVEF